MSLETDPICLALDADGDIEIPMRYLTGLDAVVQGIATRLRMIKGELRWDLDVGVPYFEREGVPASEALLGQKYDEIKIRRAVRDAILDTPNVSAILSLTVSYDGATRNVAIEWSARTTFGDTPTNLTEL